MGNLCPCFSKKALAFFDLDDSYYYKREEYDYGDEEKLLKMKPKIKKDEEVWVFIDPGN